MAKSLKWSKLDNAAKIFPPTSNEKETWVFRVACQLIDPVSPAILQGALDKTIRQFPFYTSVLRKGLFWYYFEESNIKPLVKEETKPPCSVLYHSSGNNLLFEVTYFGKRINLEVYHALSDGTGAFQFLRTLVYYYLTEKYQGSISKDISLSDSASLEDKEQDSFSKYYNKKKYTRLQKNRRAYQIRGECFPNNRMGIVEGTVSVKSLLTAAKKYKATVTEYMTAVLMCAFHDSMSLREEEKPVVIVIPINLRNFFPSESAKNFFGVSNISHNFKQQGASFEDVLEHVKEQFQANITEDQMHARLNALYGTENNLFARIVPRPVKNIILKIADQMSGKNNTASFSNVGKITMPTELSKYIELFDTFTSTKHLQVCVCSFLDNMTVSFTSRRSSTRVQRYFFKTLVLHGIPVKVASNIPENSLLAPLEG